MFENLARVWQIERAALEVVLSGDKDSAARKVFDFVRNHPAVLAPVSMLGASVVSGMNSFGGALFELDKVAARDRLRLVRRLLELQPQEIRDMTWANLLVTTNLLDWLIGLCSERLGQLRRLQNSQFDSADLRGRIQVYDAAVDECTSANETVQDSISTFEARSAQDRIAYLSVARTQKASYERRHGQLRQQIGDAQAALEAKLIDEASLSACRTRVESEIATLDRELLCHTDCCKNLRHPASNHCFEHKCRVPDCKDPTLSGSGTEPGDAFSQRAASILFSGLRTEVARRARENLAMFCDKHSWTLGHESESTEGSEKEKSRAAFGAVILLSVILLLVYTVTTPSYQESPPSAAPAPMTPVVPAETPDAPRLSSNDVQIRSALPEPPVQAARQNEALSGAVSSVTDTQRAASTVSAPRTPDAEPKMSGTIQPNSTEIRGYVQTKLEALNKLVVEARKHDTHINQIMAYFEQGTPHDMVFRADRVLVTLGEMIEAMDGGRVVIADVLPMIKALEAQSVEVPIRSAALVELDAYLQKEVWERRDALSTMQQQVDDARRRIGPYYNSRQVDAPSP